MPSPSKQVGVIIEANGRTDLDVLAALHLDVFPEAWSSAGFASLVEEAGSITRFAIYKDNRQPIGFILGRVIVDEAEILTLGVARKWQRRGVASRLLADFLQLALQRGAGRVLLEVATDNTAARALYAEHGFETVGRRSRYYERRSEPPVDGLIMSRSLHH